MDTLTPLLPPPHARPAYDATSFASSPCSPASQPSVSPPPAPEPEPSPLSILPLWTRGHLPPSTLSALPGAVLPYALAQNGELSSFARLALSPLAPPLSSSTVAYLRAAGVADAACSTALAERDEAYVRRAILASNAVNLLLVLTQLYAFFASASVTLLACFVDAVLDVSSGLVILATWRLKQTHVHDAQAYPVGKSRLEPLGVIVFACLMTTGTLAAVKEGVNTLATHPPPMVITTPVAALLLLSISAKGALYCYCKASTNVSVGALAVDHANDVLSNTMALVMVFISHTGTSLWWLDPVTGIVVSCLIIRNWTLLTLEQCDTLLSKAAPRTLLNCVVFVALNHSPAIHAIDTVRGYHVGSAVFVEVDILVDADMPLRYSHDVAESLQRRIEEIDGVERCFVHCDFETDHRPDIEHRLVW